MRGLVLTSSITRREEKALEKYLKDIAQYEVLTPEEEYDLFSQRASRGEEAIEKIVLHNLRFVVSVAKKYQDCGLPLMDLINEGNVGLLKAAKRFDETRGFKFISYAVWWIRQAMLEAINKKARKIRTPANYFNLNQQIIQFSDSFVQENDRRPTMREISAMLNIPKDHIRRARESYKGCDSLDRPVSPDSRATAVQFMEDKKIPLPDAQSLVESRRKNLKSLVATLPAREEHVLRAYYGMGRDFPATLSDIADDLDISRERVRQIRDRGIQRLRRLVNSELVS